MCSIRVLILTFAVFATVAVALQRPAEVRYQWKYLNYTWSSVCRYQEAVARGKYIPKNNFISGIKIWKGQLYLTIPRFRYGVPAALVTIPLQPVDGNRSPNLKPYPNWKMQKVGNCNAFQFLLGMEIDPKGRMWIIDSGRQAFLEDNLPLCPPRLVILDLNNNGKVLLNYQFPENVVDPKFSLLNDIVLDHTDGGYAYISNPEGKGPSIVVFSLEQKKSWSITHQSMYATSPVFMVKNDNDMMTTPINVDSIALSSASREGQRILYYSPLSSYELFSIPTDVLKRNPQDLASEVKLVGWKPSQTDGMMMTANDDLYFGLLTDNQVSRWNTREKPFTEYQQRVYEDNVALIWPDGFAIDETKKLWVTSNRFHKVSANHVDISQVNFRVINLAQLNSLSYQYYENGTAPKLPMI